MGARPSVGQQAAITDFSRGLRVADITEIVHRRTCNLPRWIRLPGGTHGFSPCFRVAAWGGLVDPHTLLYVVGFQQILDTCPDLGETAIEVCFFHIQLTKVLA